MKKESFIQVGSLVKVKTKSKLSSNIRKVMSIDRANGIFIGKPMVQYSTKSIEENLSAPVVNQLKKITHITYLGEWIPFTL